MKAEGPTLGQCIASDPLAAPRQPFIPHFRVSIVRDGSTPVDTRRVSAPSDAARILRACMPHDVDREVFAVLLLDVRHKVIGFHVASVGCLTYALVHPREVFKIAVLGNAAALVACHNHPSGDVTPSPEDVKLTERLLEAGKLIGIDVLDHIILGDGTTRWTSMRESGVIS